MIIWFTTNIYLTGCALLFLSMNKTSPHRLRFLVSFMALCAWLIPWNLVSGIFPPIFNLNFDQIQQSLSNNTLSITSITSGASSPKINFLQETLYSIEILSGLFLVISLIGIYSFLLQSYRHSLFIRKLKGCSSSGNYLWNLIPSSLNYKINLPEPDIYIQNISPGAFTSGVFAPKIWIHEDLIDGDNLPAVLIHEFKHVQHKDNIYLFFITLIQNLFWWNPLVSLIARQVRNMQELSCDEACAEILPEYKVMLSKLIVTQSKSKHSIKSPLLCSSIFNKTSFNVQRVKLLEKDYDMKPKHFFSTAIIFLTAFSAVSIVTAQSEGFTRDDMNKAVWSGQAGERTIDGKNQKIYYQLLINEDAKISINYPDGYLYTVISGITNASKQLRVHRNIDKVTNQEIEDPTYQLRLEIADKLNISALRIDDKDAYAVYLSGSLRNLSLQDTLNVLSKESSCEIFQEGEIIVIDNCG